MNIRLMSSSKESWESIEMLLVLVLCWFFHQDFEIFRMFGMSSNSSFQSIFNHSLIPLLLPVFSVNKRSFVYKWDFFFLKFNSIWDITWLIRFRVIVIFEIAGEKLLSMTFSLGLIQTDFGLSFTRLSMIQRDHHSLLLLLSS